MERKAQVRQTPDIAGPWRPPARKRKRPDEAVTPSVASLVAAKKITQVQAVRVTGLIRSIAELVVLRNARIRDICKLNRRMAQRLMNNTIPDYLQIRCEHTGIHHAVNIPLPPVSPVTPFTPLTRGTMMATEDFKAEVRAVRRSIEISFWVEHIGNWIEFIDRYPDRYPQLLGLLTYTYGLLDAFDAMDRVQGHYL